VGYAARSVLDPVLNPVGFSNLLALIAAGLITLSEAISMLTLSGEIVYVHRAAFAAGLFTTIKKLGWILATVHSRVNLVFEARKMRSLFVKVLPNPPWRQQIVRSAQKSTARWPRLGQISHRLGRDLWKGMGNLYAIIGWFSLIFIEGEFLLSAWEQVQEPLKTHTLHTAWGYGISPLVGMIFYTLLHNPEAIYRIGMAAFYLPAYWLYTKLSDHDVVLPADEITTEDATIAHIDWLLQPEWQWFWDELLSGCESGDQKYRRLQAVIAHPEWMEQVCKYLNIQASEQWKIPLASFAFMPMQPTGWFSFLRSQQEKQQLTEKAQQVISGYLKQIDEIEAMTNTEAVSSG
jgi:hypothetical protein